MWKVLEQGTDENGPIGHGWTYSAHPIGAAAGVANLKLIDEPEPVANAGEVGAYLNAAMPPRWAGTPCGRGARRGGMLCAVEFVKDRDSARFFDPRDKIGPDRRGAAGRQGVIGRAMPQGDILGFAPPFCLGRTRHAHHRAAPRIPARGSRPG
jgi:L-2,4-diaminobutyrate transaminase